MNFTQLRYVHEAVHRNFNLTEVALALDATQPGVSHAIKDLEEELGVELFVRRGKRLTGLTDQGKPLAVIIERILIDSQDLRGIAEKLAGSEQGSLTIATTHTQARYALPQVIKAFKARYPKVSLALREGSPAQLADLVLNGQADIVVATEGLDNANEFITFPCYTWHHALIVPIGHALARRTPLTLKAIAAFPIMTYAEAVTGRSHIDAAFMRAGIAPDLVLTAIDADVIKTYVEVGLGVGIIASLAFDAARDTGLQILAADHLFEANTTRLGVRRGSLLRGYAIEFMRMLAPSIPADEFTQALARPGAPSHAAGAERPSRTGQVLFDAE